MSKLLKDTLNTSKLSIIGRFSGCIAKDAAGYERIILMEEIKEDTHKRWSKREVLKFQVLFKVLVFTTLTDEATG